ncbi:MAG: beta-hexosaminidase [Firmicutes bacterium]|nr:beta-hexosaminidase [Bacillota bacterium]
MKKWICMLLAAAMLLTGCGMLAGDDTESSASIEATSEAVQEQSVITEAEESSENVEESVSAEESSQITEEGSQSEEVSQNEETESADPEAEITAQRVEEILSTMTLEEKVGQMFLARMPDSAAYYAETYQLGGYVLFDVDFNGYSKESVIERIDSCQEVSKIPMIMSVDEEGGTVTRVSDYFRETRFMSPRDVYAEGGWGGIVNDTIEKCQLLKELHLNMNLAPVCDLADDYGDYMYDRSFSGDAQEAANFIGWTISTMNEQGIASSLKHFPGYGNNVDTHTGMAIDYREAQEYYDYDLVPFMEGIKMGASSVMVSHNIVTCFDDYYPASLSPEIHRILREELGFEGVVITDDLVMDAIQQFCGEVNSAVYAVEAGNDMLISTNFESQFDSIMAAIDEGRITEERINESVRRILTMKINMGLL